MYKDHIKAPIPLHSYPVDPPKPSLDEMNRECSHINLGCGNACLYLANWYKLKTSKTVGKAL